MGANEKEGGLFFRGEIELFSIPTGVKFNI